MEAPLALYRRYRPETFAEVIGQDHVTGPLGHALRNNRVNHAYLFSGPRGCGKTTSARILARCLNCEKGPTPEPCGECQSCRDLARGGPGNIDVIEIDAASHGGVDDARDLRERAFFSPVSSRFKIYIVDEAHMVTTQGFNALLKLVEEPPEHLKFIFATTEPDKVIGTIRSRTHHYPFRLVPPKTLQDYLAELAEHEKVTIDHGVLPLVVRAGGGSVRDTLSVLDQLIGGSSDDGVTYGHAIALLGYTPDSLLDEVVDAFAAQDAGTVYGVIDKVIESGQDPKRFAEDVLHRLRDLLIVAAVPDAATRGLLDSPADQAERFGAQAARFGSADLTRAAEVINAGLTEMRGATAPRLHLELMCARVLLPGLDTTDVGLHARIDRLERRLSISAGPAEQEAAPPANPRAAAREAAVEARVATPPPAEPAPEPVKPAAEPEPKAAETVKAAEVVEEPAAEAPPPPPAPPAPTPTPVQAAAPGDLGLADVRRLWPEILDAVAKRRRLAWSLISHNAQVTDLLNGVLTVALVNPGARDSFVRSKSDEVLKEAVREILGVDWRIDPIVDSTAGPSGGGGGGGGARRPPSPEPQQDAPATPPTTGGWDEPRPAAPEPEPAPAEPAAPTPQRSSAAREAMRSSKPTDAEPEPPRNLDEDVDPETDAAVADSPQTQTELLAKEFGAQIIEERPNE
ncbi:DNA polymerase III subunit gamma and tau [Tenggerimyces flavus]|uniref:DNA polymerase III subunit gamma/tau n=1 Tax=Tenggerimyces flavus TaxID=1708749 RepID=A0ABV7Y903_9ACTN|nr:DNA polymerase III subunit gamma and tau [Tenggerimyces flavus]MBM7783573.1 DNA polymerase-3 subunit gamma/tau [Tenggerimyces flavus]